MKMLSNYPPGVSGFEYEIAGPDYEVEREEECVNCGEEVIQFVEGYRGQEWFTCILCNAYNEIGDRVEYEPDLDGG